MSITVSEGFFITVTNIAADYVLKTDISRTANIDAIKFFPGDVNDKLVIKEKSDAGPIITSLLSSDGEGRKDSDKSIGKSQSPIIDFSECTLSAGHIVTFVMRQRS